MVSFYEIYKTKKFSSAAERLHCTESTLSARIKNLETEVGAHLLVRGTKGITLSEEGSLLLPYVEKILFLLREAQQTLHEWASCNKGSISIAASNYSSCYQLPSILHAFKAVFPNVEINVRVGSSPDVINMVRNYEAQIGLVRDPLSDPLMTAIKISQDPIVLCVYPEHPLAALSFVDLKDLKDYPLISYQKGPGYWTFINNAFSTSGVTPNVFMELDSMEATKKMVSKTLGIAFLPQLVIKEELEHGILRAIKISNPPELSRATYVFFNKDKRLSGPLKDFLEIAKLSCP